MNIIIVQYFTIYLNTIKYKILYMNLDKELNIMCICGKLYNRVLKIIMILPCEHMFHEECLKKNKIEFCPICKIEIESKKSLLDDVKTKEDLQRYSDIISISNFCSLSSYKIHNVIDNLFDIGKLFMTAPFCKGIKESRNVIKKFLSLNNTNVYVRGLDRINPKEKKVFICNHSSYLDFMIVLLFLDTYFLASDFINQSIITSSLSKIIPLLIIKRGTSNNTVEQMKQFVEKYGSICVFPEGMITHPDTIIKFRTGGFYVGEPIYPIILRYKQMKNDFNIGTFLAKSSSRYHTEIYMDIIGPYNPPFSKNDIEKIRQDMANVGNMLTSRVSSRDIID